ncbi:MAG: hypothetical protein OEX18_13585 [Candidatus Krumholzibacteria bacterium]|nr:hypothetical protein [Candidatus Krumholzibacteria bacterium]MDH4338299.1 hypothetical protein [Candidatus Krumholzibacteria bacterium]MDH5268932.1 hypothetical protein [Candidatus Krumholzibacteria bacterium]
MKTLKVALIAAVATVALAHAPADAGKSGEQKRARKSERGTFVSGTYSGSLSGTIFVGSHQVVIPKKVTIYDTRRGMLEPGSSVSGRSLNVSGRMSDGKLIAGLIVVSDGPGKKDFSQETLPDVEANPNRAQ